MVKGSALNETSTSHRQNDRDGIGTKIQSLPLMNPAQQWLSAQDLYTDQGCQHCVTGGEAREVLLPPEHHREVNGRWRRKSHFFNDVAT